MPPSKGVHLSHVAPSKGGPYQHQCPQEPTAGYHPKSQAPSKGGPYQRSPQWGGAISVAGPPAGAGRYPCDTPPSNGLHLSKDAPARRVPSQYQCPQQEGIMGKTLPPAGGVHLSNDAPNKGGHSQHRCPHQGDGHPNSKAPNKRGPCQRRSPSKEGLSEWPFPQPRPAASCTTLPQQWGSISAMVPTAEGYLLDKNAAGDQYFKNQCCGMLQYAAACLSRTCLAPS